MLEWLLKSCKSIFRQWSWDFESKNKKRCTVHFMYWLTFVCDRKVPSLREHKLQEESLRQHFYLCTHRPQFSFQDYNKVQPAVPLPLCKHKLAEVWCFLGLPRFREEMHTDKSVITSHTFHYIPAWVEEGITALLREIRAEENCVFPEHWSCVPAVAKAERWNLASSRHRRGYFLNRQGRFFEIWITENKLF